MSLRPRSRDDIQNDPLGRYQRRPVNASLVSAIIFPPTLTTTRDGFASIEMGWSGPGIFIGFSGMICIFLNRKRYLGVQKPRHVRDEQRGILVLRPVIGIRIEDELRV